MKMTMHIDEDLIERVMGAHGFASKTETVDMALREMDRKTRFRALVKTGLGLTPSELKEAVDPAYDIHAMRVAEPLPAYGKPLRRSGRR